VEPLDHSTGADHRRPARNAVSVRLVKEAKFGQYSGSCRALSGKVGLKYTMAMVETNTKGEPMRRKLALPIILAIVQSVSAIAANGQAPRCGDLSGPYTPSGAPPCWNCSVETTGARNHYYITNGPCATTLFPIAGNNSKWKIAPNGCWGPGLTVTASPDCKSLSFNDRAHTVWVRP
jgi:hypothetical protein